MNSRIKEAKRIIVRCPNWVGDIVMSTPILECVRANFPDADITACVRDYATGILESFPTVDRVLGCSDKSIAGIFETSRKIKALEVDTAILLPNSTRSFIPFYLAGVKNIFGYKRNLRRFLLTDGPLPLKESGKIKPMTMLDYYFDFCRFLGLEVQENPKPHLFVGEALRRESDELLLQLGITAEDNVIGLNPGASFGSSKCWSAESFARLAELLKEKISCKLLMFAGPGEEGITDKIVATSSVEIINTASYGVKLDMLKPLVERCALLITNDTGPRHYAVAFDVPVVVLFGSTDPRYTNSNLEMTSIVRRDIECSPCHKKICPLDHRCMTEITPEEVLKEALKLLNDFAHLN